MMIVAISKPYIYMDLAYLLLDRLFLQSDAYRLAVCKKCGLFAEDPSGEEKPFCRSVLTHVGVTSAI